MLFDILALISLLVILLLIRRIVDIFPSLMACMIRWKENVNLQASMKMRTDRDLLAAALFIPFCLVVFRFKMYCPEFLSGLGEATRLWATAGICCAYLLLRIACRFLFKLHDTPKSTYKTAAESFKTYFIILTLMLLATGGILSFLNVSPMHINAAMFWISGAIYMVFILRKTQIFLSSCNLFVSFLYLCALEILPTGVLMASAVIF